MSQRRALIASILFTLVLALSAIGIRAAMTDAPAEDAAAKSPLPLLVTGSDNSQGDDEGTYDDDRDENEGDEGDEYQTYASSRSDDNDTRTTPGEVAHEENDDDD